MHRASNRNRQIEAATRILLFIIAHIDSTLGFRIASAADVRLAVVRQYILIENIGVDYYHNNGNKLKYVLSLL